MTEMATTTQKKKLCKMFKWSIMKLFEDNECATLSLAELKWVVRDAWDELHEEGKIV